MTIPQPSNLDLLTVFDFGSLILQSAPSIPPGTSTVLLQETFCTHPLGRYYEPFASADCKVFIIPVELINFKGTPYQAEILLQWETASELNNAGFEVQRSKDGQNWEVLDFVKGYGTTVETQQYKWLDEQPYTGGNYYQLKQVDEDGSAEYSEIVVVEKETKDTDLEVFPNPTQNTLQYRITDMDALARVQLFDIYGKRLMTDFDIDGILNLEGLPKGMYFLFAETSMHQYRQMVVKN